MSAAPCQPCCFVLQLFVSTLKGCLLPSLQSTDKMSLYPRRFFVSFCSSLKPPNSCNYGLFLTWHLMHFSSFPVCSVEHELSERGGLQQLVTSQCPSALIITRQDANWLSLALKLTLKFCLMFGFPYFGLQFVLRIWNGFKFSCIQRVQIA